MSSQTLIKISIVFRCGLFPRTGVASKSFFLIVAIALLSMVGGCKPKDIAVSGQVFVVTKGAENVKLGDVQIVVLEKTTAMKYLAGKQIAFEAQHRSLIDETKELELQLKKARDDYAAFLKASPFKNTPEFIEFQSEKKQVAHEIELLDESLDKFQESNERLRIAARAILKKQSPEFIHLEYLAFSVFYPEWQGVSVRNVPPGTYESKEFKAWRDFIAGSQQEARGLMLKRAPLAAKLNSLSVQLDLIASRSDSGQKAGISGLENRLTGIKARLSKFHDELLLHLFHDFPQEASFREVHTDADGKFSVVFPSGTPFTIFATAERLIAVADSPEKYFWLINAPDESTSSLILSNKRLIEVDPDGYLKIFSHL